MNEIKAKELNLSSKAEDILLQIESNTMLGNLRKIAKEIKNHEIASQSE